MPKVKLRVVEWSDEKTQGFYTMAVFICPGCRHIHQIGVAVAGNVQKPVWGFNWDLETPTFSPSIKTSIEQRDKNGNVIRDKKGNVLLKTQCHSYVTNGKIKFGGDCVHSLANKEVELPEIPVDHWLNNE